MEVPSTGELSLEGIAYEHIFASYGNRYTDDDEFQSMNANSLSDFWIDDYSNDWYSYADFESLCTHDGDNISENLKSIKHTGQAK